MSHPRAAGSGDVFTALHSCAHGSLAHSLIVMFCSCSCSCPKVSFLSIQSAGLSLPPWHLHPPAPSISTKRKRKEERGWVPYTNVMPLCLPRPPISAPQSRVGAKETWKPCSPRWFAFASHVRGRTITYGPRGACHFVACVPALLSMLSSRLVLSLVNWSAVPLVSRRSSCISPFS